MKWIRLISVFIVFLLSACASTQHSVDRAVLDKVKAQTFHISKVEIPCDALARFPWPPFRNDKEYQLAILENIPVGELLNILSEGYGLSIAQNDQLTLKSSTRDIRGLLTESYGKCLHKENEITGNDKNVINILYKVGGVFAPPMPATISIGYEVIVKSEDKVLVKHRGEMESLKLSFFDRSAWNGAPQQIVDYAKLMSSALRRDINNGKIEEAP